MRASATALAVLALAAPAAAAADTITRCTGPAGAVTWSNVGCGGSERAEPVTVSPAVVDSRGLRDWAKRSPARRAPRDEGRPREPRPARLRDTVACENARRAWRFESGYSMSRRGSLGPLREEVRLACGGG